MTKLVGILNITPDSFTDGGKYLNPDTAFAHAEKLFQEGAEIVDIGAESTRPGAVPISAEEEWRRLSPVMELVRVYKNRISLETYHPETVERALAFGPVIINDVTGFRSERMRDIARESQSRCIIGHMPAPTVAQAHGGNKTTTKADVLAYLTQAAESLMSRGLPQEKIILDPWVGLGKTRQVNWQLLGIAEDLSPYEVMIGYSKKGFLGEGRLELAANLRAAEIAIHAGTAYLRVHDVAGHAHYLATWDR